MKLSHCMVNFLGWLAEQEVVSHWCTKQMAVALAYPFGVKSALKNGLIREHESGYQLTELGLEIGAVGIEQRKTPLRDKEWWTRHVAKAQKLLDERQSCRAA